VNKPDQYPALTSLRFVAALLVFLFHFQPEGAAWQIVAPEGHVGVNIFFVLSGFLITLRYADGFARGGIRLSEYFVRRAARILPLYYAVFFLSLALGRGEPELSWALWPELTLTQALFGESVQTLVIPTSWSLTVEECFYATAPLVLWGIARARTPRRPLLSAAMVLAVVTLVLFALGALVWTILDGRGPGFLRAPDQVVRHTIFGRFYDFAIGAFAARLFSAGGRWKDVLARRWPGLAATAVAAVLVGVSQWGMHAAGGVDGPHWAQAWSWSVLLAPATALLILALTSPGNPAARALGIAPLEYLGKVSYALYLVQSTPLGKGLFYRLIPHTGDFTLVLLYAGMTLVSAALYELVEEPARKLVLRVAGLEKRAVAAPRAPISTPIRLATAGVLALSLALQCATWAMASLSRAAGPVPLEELRAAGLRDTDVHQALHNDVRWGRDVILAGIPRRWREGWRHDLRAPSGLYVFADGRAIPFSRREPAGDETAAFFRGPRAEHLAVRLTAMPQDLTLIRRWPPTEVRLHLSRLRQSPRECAAVGVLFAVVLALAFVALRRLAPRPALALALGLLLAWWVFGLYGQTWALGVIVGECAAGIVLAVRAAAWVGPADRALASRS